MMISKTNWRNWAVLIRKEEVAQNTTNLKARNDKAYRNAREDIPKLYSELKKEYQ